VLVPEPCRPARRRAASPLAKPDRDEEPDDGDPDERLHDGSGDAAVRD
jgi:hypothetical protein